MKDFNNFSKRYYTEYGIYFITANTKDRISFFKEEIFCDLMIEELKLVKEIYQCKIFGLVINYEHCHLLIQHADVGKRNISCVMKSLKRNFSQDANKVMGYNWKIPAHVASKLPDQVTTNPDSSLPGRDLPKEKGLMNYFILQKRQKFITKYGKDQIIFPKFIWQHSFYDHRIRDKDDLVNALEYIDINPVKHGIITPGELYKYCSTHNKFDFIDEPLF